MISNASSPAENASRASAGRLLRRAAGQRDPERGHRAQGAGARTGSARTAPDVIERAELGRVDGAERRPDQADGAEPVAEVIETGGELRGRLGGQLDALLRRAYEQQQMAEADGRPGALGRVGQLGVGAAQRLDSGRSAHVGGAAPELERERRLLVRRGRLGLGPLEQPHRRVGGPAPKRDMGRFPQPAHDPGVAPRRREQQLGGDALRAGAELGEQPCRPLVLECAHRGGELAVDGVADQRVDEAERLVGTQDLRAGERLHGIGGRRFVDLGERGDRRKTGLLAEHRDRASDGGRRRGQAAEAEQHRPGDGTRTDRADGIGVPGVRDHALGGERAEQLAQEQRIAGGDLAARRCERLVRLVVESHPNESGGRSPRERARRQRERYRLLGELSEQRLVGLWLAAADRGRDQHRQARHPTGEIRGEAQRGRIAPLKVVDAERERL